MMYAVNFPRMRECEQESKYIWQVHSLLTLDEGCSRWRVVLDGSRNWHT